MRTRLLVVSPWGVGSSYSGPAVLMDRLFTAVAGSLTIDVLYGDSADAQKPDWARHARLVLKRSSSFGRREQLHWMLASTIFILRHRRDYDIVHLHGLYATNYPAMVIARVVGLKVVALPVLQNGDLRPPSGRFDVARRLRDRAVSRLDVGFALSSGIASELGRSGMPCSRIVPIGNAVDTKVFRPRVKPASEHFTVGFVGKVGRKKGAHLLIEALRELRAEFPVRGVFVGPMESAAFGAEFADLSRGLDILTTGYVNDVAPHIVDVLDVFVLASEMEGLPGALVEAMACGLPCIVTDVGAMGDVVRAAGCGIVVSRDPREIARAICHMRSQPELRREFGDHARAYAEAHYSTDHIAATYLHAVEVPA